MTRREFLRQSGLAAAACSMPLGFRARRDPYLAPALDPTRLTPFVDPLPIPMQARPVAATATAGQMYRLRVQEIRTRIHRDLPPTRVWTFGSTFPGPTIDVRRGTSARIEWTNALPPRHFLPIDHTIHGAGEGVPESRAVVHVHGAKVKPESDGNPEHWLPPGESVTFDYPNDQPAATLWYHDHTMCINRLNVYAGLLAAYLIRDDEEDRLDLPDRAHELPLLLCDRLLDPNGQLVYPTSDDPSAPWVPEVFGDAILANGKLFPFFDADATCYRLRIVNACNGRFLSLGWSDGLAWHQVGGDQGFLPAVVSTDRLELAPAERADVLVDLSGRSGESFTLSDGPRVILQLRAGKRPTAAPRPIPTAPRSLSRLEPSTALRTRTHTLAERTDLIKRPMQMLLNDTPWHMPVTEVVTRDSIEIWNLVNLTDDAHPIHLHLVRFQVLDRRKFDLFAFTSARDLRFTGPVVPPEPGESGWKDTVRAYAGMVTRIIVKFEGYLGRYMWHCHVLEHGDHEMMRPFEIVTARAAPSAADSSRRESSVVRGAS